MALFKKRAQKQSAILFGKKYQKRVGLPSVAYHISYWLRQWAQSFILQLCAFNCIVEGLFSSHLILRWEENNS